MCAGKQETEVAIGGVPTTLTVGAPGEVFVAGPDNHLRKIQFEKNERKNSATPAAPAQTPAAPAQTPEAPAQTLEAPAQTPQDPNGPQHSESGHHLCPWRGPTVPSIPQLKSQFTTETALFYIFIHVCITIEYKAIKFKKIDN